MIKDKNILFGFIPGYGVCDTIIFMTSFSCHQVATVEWFSTTLFLCHLNRLVIWMRRTKRKDHRKRGQLSWYKISLCTSFCRIVMIFLGRNLKISRQLFYAFLWLQSGGLSLLKKALAKKDQRGRSHSLLSGGKVSCVEQALDGDHHHFLLLLWPESLLLIDVPGPVSPQKTES